MNNFSYGTVIQPSSVVQQPTRKLERPAARWLLPVHDPTLDLHTQFCPCGCNKERAYTSIVGNAVSHAKPVSINNWKEWRNCELSWEEPNLSRLTTNPPRYSVLSQTEALKSISLRLEKNIVLRLLPDYSKSARILIGNLDSVLWPIWIKKISIGAPIVSEKKWSSLVPSHRKQKHRVRHHKVTWSGDVMPTLSEQRPYWWLKKWITEDGDIYRAQVTELTLFHNLLTEKVTANMKYTTEFFSSDNRKWCSV